MKTYERDGVIYITAPALDIGSCNGCAANDLSNEPDCAGFPAASFNNEDDCYGCIWIKSPEQNKDQEIKEWFKAKKFTLDEMKRIKELIGD